MPGKLQPNIAKLFSTLAKSVRDTSNFFRLQDGESATIRVTGAPKKVNRPGMGPRISVPIVDESSNSKYLWEISNSAFLALAPHVESGAESILVTREGAERDDTVYRFSSSAHDDTDSLSMSRR